MLGLLPPLLISSEVFYKYTFPSLPSSPPPTKKKKELEVHL